MVALYGITSSVRSILKMPENNKMYICTHCGRADIQKRSWPQKCQLHSMYVPEECVVTTKGKIGRKVKFYDPDPQIVQAYCKKHQIELAD